METPRDRSWLDPRLGPATSAIEGVGEFATAPIRAGERLKELGGRMISDKEMRRIAASGDRYSALRVGSDIHLLMDWDDPASRGNHSCDPNTWLDSQLIVTARRDIAAGEEVTIDYATMTVGDGWQMECRCGSRLCRGIVTGQDWRLPEVRERYQGHFIPWIDELLGD